MNSSSAGIGCVVTMQSMAQLAVIAVKIRTRVYKIKEEASLLCDGRLVDGKYDGRDLMEMPGEVERHTRPDIGWQLFHIASIGFGQD